MLYKKTLVLFVLAILAVSTVGCGSATPTSVVPTPSPVQVTVVVTATPPPPTATSEAPSITPLPTEGVTETVPAAVTPLKPTTAAGTPKPAATKKPAPPATTVTPSPLPLTLPAPVLNRPLWTDSQKDEVKFPGGAIVFDWQSVGALGQDECYLVQVRTEPVNPGPGIGTGSDFWVTKCGDQTQSGYSVKFTLESPNRPGIAPSYSSVLLSTSQMWAHWSITVVKNLGQCDPSYQFHCKTVPLSPSSNAYFLFKGS